MDLISCDNCGVVIDVDKIFLNEVYDHDGVVCDHVEVEGDEYVAKTICPVCDTVIIERRSKR